MARACSATALQWWQISASRHQQTGRHLFTHAADSWSKSGEANNETNTWFQFIPICQKHSGWNRINAHDSQRSVELCRFRRDVFCQPILCLGRENQYRKNNESLYMRCRTEVISFMRYKRQPGFRITKHVVSTVRIKFRKSAPHN